MNKELDLLNKIYAGTKIGSSSLNALLPNVSNISLRKAIIEQINDYDAINTEAKMHIFSLGEKPRSNRMTVMSARAEAKLNSTVNSSPSHIAETVIKGSGMGIISITKELNRSNGCSPTAYNIGRKLLKAEEENISRIKMFL